MGSEEIFPQVFDNYDKGELNGLLKAFGPDFHAWAKDMVPTSFDAVLCHTLHFLHKYTWCLPSNTQSVVPDVSLYDHLKTTAAIAACLYLHHQENSSLVEKAIRTAGQTRFCLVAGDISGIQSYIFGISNIGAGGVARKLRSRSLFVQLVTEACAHRLLKDSGLPITNILMSAGGNFHLLLPNNSNTEAKLQKANQEIDEWFLKNLNGEMALNLAHVEFDGDSFQGSSEKSDGFGGVLRDVHDKLAHAKQRRFASLWQQKQK